MPAKSRQIRFKRVLAAVNAATSKPVEEALNTKILELATSPGKLEGAEIHVVHCWSVVGESLLAGPRGPLTNEEMKAYRKRLDKGTTPSQMNCSLASWTKGTRSRSTSSRANLIC